MSIDDRLEALTMNMELAWREIEAHRQRMEKMEEAIDKRMEKTQDQIEKILTLAETQLAITKRHERRSSNLEGS